MYTFNLQYIISLGWEDPLEEGMATHSIFLPEESSWTEEPGGLQSMGLQRVTHDWATNTHTHTHTHTHTETHTVVGWGRFILVLNAKLRILNFETLLETTVSCFRKTVICSGFHTIHISAQKHNWLVATLT